MTQKSIAELIKQRREELGISAAVAADFIGCDETEFATLETGEARIAAGRLLRLSELFGVDIGYFFEADAQQAEKAAQRPGWGRFGERRGT